MSDRCEITGHTVRAWDVRTAIGGAIDARRAQIAAGRPKIVRGIFLCACGAWEQSHTVQTRAFAELGGIEIGYALRGADGRVDPSIGRDARAEYAEYVAAVRARHGR